MTLLQLVGVLLIFIVCPILGGLPLISGITWLLTGKQLAKLGTGNISVSAAFYHGGRWAGILAVLSEAGKGIGAVLLTRLFFPTGSPWELIALAMLVFGRYFIGKGAGTTNAVWGSLIHDWEAALLVFLIGSISFTILRERNTGRLGVLVLFPMIIALLPHRTGENVGAAIALSTILALVYQRIPDDLELSASQAQTEAQPVFKFFRGDRAIISLGADLDPGKVGQKAATLSRLKRLGYPVPDGWVLPPGDDFQPLMEFLQPSPDCPLVVRSSAVGEDSAQASAAGQYQSILNVTSQQGLEEAIAVCLASYDRPAAIQYRHDRNLPEAAMAIFIQKQIKGVFSGVAFSRDPITQYGDAVLIEGLPGDATRVVSGKVTPDSYQVWGLGDGSREPSFSIPDGLALQVAGEGDLPPHLLQQVAYLTRNLEAVDNGIPQDVEWSYDGQQLWLLQSRPITTLLPLWTRKIAAEVIPGLIRPLTWSINRPLTCGVWGEIFTIGLGKASQGLDFTQTATLHFSRAYFNASLLGQIFRLMGLPAESLEFLTRGARMTKPSLLSVFKNLPGLGRLLAREWSLETDFQKDYQRHFKPILQELQLQPASQLTPKELLARIDNILPALKRATYYSILAPLSAALRQTILRVPDTQIDSSLQPEVASMRSLQKLATTTRSLFNSLPVNAEALFLALENFPEGKVILEQFEQWWASYGYLSEVGSDIAVETWRENPSLVRELFYQFLTNPTPNPAKPQKTSLVQPRWDLKGQVAEVYYRLLAELRWSFVALEQIWLSARLLAAKGDIFFLEFPEIRALVNTSGMRYEELVTARRSQLDQHQQLTTVPDLVYGNAPPLPIFAQTEIQRQRWQGIAASPGQIEGRVKIVRHLQAAVNIDRQTILVVPYTDSGWSPLLSRAGGLIAEVGGRLSHGAIVAREYGIPAVMDIRDATHWLRDGQRVRIDGQLGTVELLEE